MADRPINMLALAIANWAVRIGAENLNQLPGLWKQDTAPMGEWGPLHVEVNAHDFDVDSVGAFTFIIHPAGNPLGFLAAVTPYGGSIMAAGRPAGDLEDMLIAHFEGLGVTP